MMDLNYTNEEIDALKKYLNEDYEAINQMLVSNSETDIALLSEDVENKVINISYTKDSVIRYLKNIKLIYKLMLKQYYKSNNKYDVVLYRGTNLAEVERFKTECFVDRFLMATKDKDDAINKYSANWNRPTCLNIKLNKDVPFIYVNDILKDENDDRILISPFTKVKKIDEDEEQKLDKNSKTIKIYNLVLDKQVLEELKDRERNGLYNYILENSYFIKRKLEECIHLEKENTINFENIRKLEQLLSKYENNEDVKDEEFEENLTEESDITRIQKELEELKNKSNELFEIRKENINFVNVWKRNIAVYIIAECEEIEKEFIDVDLPEDSENIEINEEDVKTVEENTENIQSEENKKNTIEEKSKKELVKETIETIKDKIEEVKEKIEDTIIVPIINSKNKKEEIKKEDENSIAYIVKNECKENIDTVKKLISDINDLISKQQNHAKIASNIGTSYSALNNSFEMRKSAETLLRLLERLQLKAIALTEDEQTDEIKDKLNQMSKNNIQISTLLNYLNNPKIVARNSKATRFEEMAIIEENELKRKITERIREIRGEAELKKLRDDLEIIEDKSAFSRFIGFFTGQNKLDDFMIEQIEVRQNAIKRTLSQKLSLACNYSIHQLIAEIEMFVQDNEDDELVENDVLDLKAMADELRRNYVVLETKVTNIKQDKESKNLPVNAKKMSRKEIIEIETYRFLNKYGYDINIKENEEPKYQDTMTSEINRIIEYVNSSNI